MTTCAYCHTLFLSFFRLLEEIVNLSVNITVDRIMLYKSVKVWRTKYECCCNKTSL